MSGGRVDRVCTCRDPLTGKQVGKACPQLGTDTKHGAWMFAVDLPIVDGRRKAMRRRGFPTRSAARRACDDVVARHGAGFRVDDRETVAGYLTTWLRDMRHKLKPKTHLSYSEYVTKDLVPALGALRLKNLRHEHVADLIAELEAAGRGAPTIRRMIAVLSSALADAVERRRLTQNAARHAPLPLEGRAERTPWTAEQASAAGVGMSARVVAALRRQEAAQAVEHTLWAEAYDEGDLVFARENGRPLLVKQLLVDFHRLAKEAGVPYSTIHDLRHLTATMMLSSGVPLAVVSKMLRHSKISMTVDLYGHLSRETSTAAADTYGAVLDAATAELAAERAAADATTTRPREA